MPETATKLAKDRWPKLFEEFPEAVVGAEKSADDLCLHVSADALLEMIEFLRDDAEHEFKMLIDLFGMDYLKWEPPTEERFAVVYILYSFKLKVHLHLKVFLSEESPEVASLVNLYKAANWFEREAWDLFGIRFLGHPRLIRILCHNEFEGHALRKDYPSDKYQSLKKAIAPEDL